MNQTRSLIGFVDLTLILMGSMALIGSFQQTSDLPALADQRPVKTPEENRQIVAIENLFESGEARLSDTGRLWIDQAAKRAGGEILYIRVAAENDGRKGRLDGWEKAAARTASIVYALEEAGHPHDRLRPQLPTEDDPSGMVTILQRP